MTGDSEDTLNIPKLSEAKSAIYESVNQLRKWRESQLQKFQTKQLTEHLSLLEQSEKNRKNLEQFLENNQEGISAMTALLKNQMLDGTSDSATGSESTLQDSSVTGHFLRCFSDTSGDSSTLNQSKEASHMNSFPSGRNNFGDALDKKNNFIEEYLDKHNSAAAAPKRPKQPFLKKGSGLLRYTPKQNRDISNLHKSSAPQKTISETQTKSALKSKLAIQKSTSARQLNRVQFREPVAFMHREKLSPESPNQEMPECNLFENRSSGVKHNNVDDCSNVQDFEDNCDVHLSVENQELAEFEMLENCAQNSSFNSDSSVVQRVLHGEPIEKLYPVQKPSLQNYVKEFRHENLKRTIDLPISSAKNNQNKNLEEIEIRKQQLQNLISDINPRITSLQNEISGLNKNTFEGDKEVSERCSTPIEHESHNAPQSPGSNDNSSKDSSLDSIIFVPPSQTSIATEKLNLDVDGEKNENNYKNHALNFEQKETASNLNPEMELNHIPLDKQKLREKMIELENEIEIYQETNARLSVIRKEREEILKKLKKEHDGIQKYKEDEKRKLDIEIENERKQLKRQKETFNRFQKLRRDNPGKKEREELSALRQEIEKLQESMKRQKNKFTSDCRRMKNQLIAAEKERDTLKLENITLEEQCQDLLTALRGRNTKKKPEVQIKADSKVERQTSCSDTAKTADKVGDTCAQDVLQPTELNPTDHNCKSDSSPVKLKVRFNLIPEYDHDASLGIQKDLVHDIYSSSEIDQPVQSNAVKNSEVDVGDEILNEEIVFQEIRQGDKLERIYFSGEREIILPSGTLKHISPDGKTTKILYYNGDIKEIFPDKSEIYRYVTGVVEKHFPSGLEITEFPNGQIQQIHPDGLKEVRFPDSTTQYIFPNGTEEVLGEDGTVLRLDADGTETIEFSNGEKLIRTATSKRREYPDGSVKIIYNSGRQETRFANGRIRIKDKDGKLVVDTKHLKGVGG